VNMVPHGTQSPGKSFPLSAILVIILALALLCFIAGKPDDVKAPAAALLFQRLLVISSAGLILVAASLPGFAILRILRVELETHLEQFLFAAGLGLGLTSFITLVSGARCVFFLLFAVFLSIVFCRKRLTRFLTSAVGSARKVNFSSIEKTMIALGFVALLFMLAGLFLPPLDYDVVEYHLGAPARYLAEGRVVYLPGNVYSNFPFNIEMLYFFALSAFGGTPFGVYVAKMINFFLAVLTALAIFRIGQKFFSPVCGALSAAIYITTPWVFVVSIKAYVTQGWAFYTALCLLAFLSYLEGAGRNKYVILAGITAGLAAGCKYPAVLYLVLFVFLAIATHMLFLRAGLKKIIKDSFLFGGLSLLCLSPWMIKNIVYTGNPVYPLMYSVFDGRDWDEMKNARWKRAHSPDSYSLKEAAAAAVDLFRPSRDQKSSILLIVFIPLLVFVRTGRKYVFYLVGFSLYVLGVWLFFTHRIGRFMVPAFPALSLLSAVGVCCIRFEKLRRYATAASALGLAFMCFYTFTVFGIREPLIISGPYHNIKNPDEIYEGLPIYPAVKFAAEHVSAESKMLLIGEAKFFFFPKHVDGYTVFNGLPLPADPGEGYRWLKKNKYKYVFVNYAEVGRFDRTYAFTYKGARIGGFYELDPVRFFARLHFEGKVRIAFPVGPERKGAFPALVIYEIL